MYKSNMFYFKANAQQCTEIYTTKNKDIEKQNMHKGQIYDFSHIILLPSQHII